MASCRCRSGYIRALEEKNDMESRGRIENVQELKSNILGFLEQQPEDPTLSGFLNEIALYTDLDSLEGSDDCVTMMTMHAAKGLEFPAVYVVGLEEGLFPSANAAYNEEELEEERRLCYVAMTRAKQQLTMTNARQRMLYGKTTPSRPSRFLEEIPEENMEWSGKPQPRVERSGWDDDWGSTSWSGGRNSYGGIGGYSGGYSGGYGQRSEVGRWADSPVSGYRETRLAAEKPRSTAAAKPKPAAGAALQLQVGDIVEHSAFGRGEVRSMKAMGGDALIEVSFDSGTTKKLMLKAAGVYMKKI